MASIAALTLTLFPVQSPSVRGAVNPRSTAATTGIVVRAAGDIACDPKAPAFAGKDPDKCQQRTTASLLKGSDLVLALGDTQYECGGTRAYQRSYDPSWGVYLKKTFAVPGDQEYETQGTEPGSTDCSTSPDAAGYYSYFGNRGGSIADAPRPGVTQSSIPGVYSLNLPRGCTPGDGGTCTGHVIGLNSVCSAIGGCGAGKPMEEWLSDDLVANTWARCSLAMIHVPRFASKASGTQEPSDKYQDLWQDFVSGGVDVVLSGNSHFYERFAPQDAAGDYDPNGTVQWVVGTGGKNHAKIAGRYHRLPNSKVGQSTAFGVLQLTLGSGQYNWRFLPVPGSTFKDAGVASCT